MESIALKTPLVPWITSNSTGTATTKKESSSLSSYEKPDHAIFNDKKQKNNINKKQWKISLQNELEMKIQAKQKSDLPHNSTHDGGSNESDLSSRSYPPY